MAMGVTLLGVVVVRYLAPSRMGVFREHDEQVGRRCRDAMSRSMFDRIMAPDVPPARRLKHRSSRDVRPGR
jgi:hypothetical protein